MTFQKYPVGHQDFEKIISEGFVYVDKTHFIQRLAEQGGYYFLSRPRRFGKSLFLSTLNYLFKGKKELFKGLFIENQWEFDEYPIISISFSSIGYREIPLNKALDDVLNKIGKEYGIQLNASSPSLKFEQLISSLHKKYSKKVVILIDEYDKPLIDYLDVENIHLARENRSILKSFYSVLKDADQHLKLVFITGISKFSQVSIFSDLNNLYDLTLREEFNEICGISQKEAETYFPLELEKFNRQKIKEWYNGYRWNISGDTVYNPFSLLNFFSGGGDFQNFWFSTGTPTFLMNMCKEQKFYDVANLQVNSFVLSNFDIDKLEILPILFQTGYVTMIAHDREMDRIRLDYPNREVRSSYLLYLTQAYMNNSAHEVSNIPFDLLDSLKEKNALKMKNAINAAFHHIPYPLWQKDNEHFYHAVVHLMFSLLGVYIQSEVHTKDGRADAIINLDEGVFCLEFKLNKSAQEAIQQVKDKKYLAAYEQLGKPMHIIGINFSREKKEVEELVWEADQPDDEQN